MIIKIDNKHAVNPDKVVFVEEDDNQTRILVEVGKSYHYIKVDISYKKVIALLNGKEY